MGGRGIHVDNNNYQISLEHYMLGQEIKEIHSRVETLRRESDQIQASSDQALGGGKVKNSQSAMKRCACCGSFSIPAFSWYETCPVCGWIDDPRQNQNPDLEAGANPISLKEAIAQWRGKCSKESEEA